MAVEAVFAVTLEKLTDLLIQDSIAFDNVIDQIEDIRIQLRLMRGFLIHAESGQVSDAAAAWSTLYLSLIFSAENKIEYYALDARRRRIIGFFQSRGFTLLSAAYDFFGPCKLFRRELNSLADEIKALEKLKPGSLENASLRARNPDSDDELESALRRSLPDGSLGNSGFESPSPDPSHHEHPELTNIKPDQEGPTLIGFTGDLRKLVDRIKGKQGEGIIPLVGPAGSGKTNLVQKIYSLRRIKTHFNCRAWIQIPDQPVSIPKLLANLLQQVLKSKEGGGKLNEEQLISRVSESLKDKTYLVVLDNISDDQSWGKLRRAFPNLGTDDSKSKVIIITRDQSTAALLPSLDSTVCGQPHDLKKLCDEHSWELFARKSYIDVGSEPLDEDEGFKKEILQKCGGCPFRIVLLGGLLSTKGPGYDEWKWYLSQASWNGEKILPLSYNDLPAHSKLCLLYMALFPNESDIPVRRVLRLWLAEGFVRRVPGSYEEDTVEKCFDDLVQRNLITISKYRSDGSPQKCHMPHALFDYLLPIAQQISLFYIHQDHEESVPSASVSPTEQESVNKLGVRRVVEYMDIKSYNPTPTSYEDLRSYLSFNFQRNDSPATEVGNFISKTIGSKGFGLLRVLDLEGVYKPTLPETLKQLFHLRYLGLRWTFIDHLPESVGKLPYLETLDLKRTYINSLPSSIWKLKHLRHLNLPGIRLDYNQKKGLIELRTLVGLIVDDKTAVKDELSHICELRELGITCQSIVFEELMSWIQKLTNLRFLWLKSKDEMGRPSEIKLEPLSELSHLSHVSLLGNIGKLPTLNEFPPKLKVLALSGSRLKDDPMTILSQLPNLTVLRLLADSYSESVMNCPANGFKTLQVLRLWMLKELVKWTVQEGAMPNLKELSIRYCCKLEQLPDGLMDLDSLEELTLTAMPKEFVDKVKQKDKRRATLTLNDYNGKLILNCGTSFEVDHDSDDVADCVYEPDSWRLLWFFKLGSHCSVFWLLFGYTVSMPLHLLRALLASKQKLCKYIPVPYMVSYLSAAITLVIMCIYLLSSTLFALFKLQVYFFHCLH
ncbi:hypothetical protein V2J09_017906 [Rumex salicifolius]